MAIGWDLCGRRRSWRPPGASAQEVGTGNLCRPRSARCGACPLGNLAAPRPVIWGAHVHSRTKWQDHTMTQSHVILQSPLDPSMVEAEGKWKFLRPYSGREKQQRGKILPMDLAFSAQQRNLVVCCRIPLAKFVKRKKKTSLG